VSKKTRFFKPRTEGDEEDKFGLNILTDGDRMGEIIPSLHAWMPPEALKERAAYHEEVTEGLTKSKRGRKTKSDQKSKKATQELLEEYSRDLTDDDNKDSKGPRRPSG